MPADPVAFLSALALANLAGGAGILIVFALRRPVQRWAGPVRAIWLWLIPLAAAAASLLPARVGLTPVATSDMAAPFDLTPAAPISDAAFDQAMGAVASSSSSLLVADPLPALLLAAWVCGAAIFLGATLLHQRASIRRFGRLTRVGDGLRAEAGDAGPAVIGILRPQLVTPADFDARFDARERDMVIAHERAHIAAQHTRVNAALVLLGAINWFNPLIHWASRLVRADQELVCDAAVAARYPGERRIYAEALLKTQLTSASLPLGCTWPSRSSSLLKERVTMLASKPPTRAGRLAGAGLISLAVATGSVAAWAAKPPRLEAQPTAAQPIERPVPALDAQTPAPVVGPLPTARPVPTLSVREQPAPDLQQALDDALGAREQPAPDTQQSFDDALGAREVETPRGDDEPLAPANMSALADTTITCNRWNGRHSRDHLVVWAEVKGDLGVTLTFTDHYDPRVTFPNDAFPKGVYPESVAYPRPGMNLRNPDRYVYQSVSESVVDTITIEGLAGGELRAVWQRFRMDEAGAHSIVLQGSCSST